MNDTTENDKNTADATYFVRARDVLTAAAVRAGLTEDAARQAGDIDAMIEAAYRRGLADGIHRHLYPIDATLHQIIISEWKHT